MFLNSHSWNKFEPICLVLMCEVVFSDLHLLSRFKQLSIVLICSVGLSSFEQFRITHSCSEVTNLLASTSHHVTFLLYCYPVLAFLMGKSGGPRCPRCQVALADLRSDRLRQAWAEFPGVKWSWVGERAFWKLCLQCPRQPAQPASLAQLCPTNQRRPALLSGPASQPRPALLCPAQPSLQTIITIYYLFTMYLLSYLLSYLQSIFYLFTISIQLFKIAIQLPLNNITLG